ncbi:MAG: hypothetical protein Q8L14_09075 [Myxococcales bacterium]|nr:hypothetical protein [Myxococcales bacterium]
MSLSYAQTKEADPSRFVRTRERLEALLATHRQRWLMDAQVTEPQWRWGLLRRCAVSVDPEQLFQAQMASDDASTAHFGLLVDELSRVLNSPAGRFLEAAALQLPGGLGTIAPLLSLLGRHPLLRGLTLAGRGAEFGVRFEEAPTITRWRLLGVPISPATHVPSTLELLEVIDTPLFPGAEELLAAPAPSLTMLGLTDDHLELARLLPRLTPATHPKLRRLRLSDDAADGVLIALAESPLLKQLEVLQLHGPFTDVGLDVVTRAAARFSRIPKLSFTGGSASASLKRMAYKQLPQLELAMKRPVVAWTGW